MSSENRPPCPPSRLPVSPEDLDEELPSVLV